MNCCPGDLTRSSRHLLTAWAEMCAGFNSPTPSQWHQALEETGGKVQESGSVMSHDTDELPIRFVRSDPTALQLKLSGGMHPSAGGWLLYWHCVREQ